MKNLLLLFAFGILAGCSSDEEPTPKVLQSAKPGTMTGLLNGKDAWVSKASETAIHFIGERIRIEAKASDGSSVVLIVAASEVGTYKNQKCASDVFKLDLIGSSAIYHPKNVGFENPSFTLSNYGSIKSPEATITIDQIDSEAKTMSGTFELKLARYANGIEFLDIIGEFTQVNFIEELIPLPDNIFSGEINGELFSPSNIKGVESYSLVLFFGNGQQVMSLILHPEITEGTYDLGSEESPENYGYYRMYESCYRSSSSGSAFITLHDRENSRIEGTFNFDIVDPMTDKISIEGAFAITYAY